jgi:hypothetical protein
MSNRLAAVKAGLVAAVFAVPLGTMLFVPLWFVLAFLSRLVTGHINRATFVAAGVAAAAFMVWVFRMAFAYFKQGFMHMTDRPARRF